MIQKEESMGRVHEEALAEPKRRSLLIEVLVRLVKEKPLGTVGGALVLVFFLVGILADYLAPYGYNEFNARAFLKPPSGQFILGTDNVGRDILSRVIFGARISMIVGLAGACLQVVIAVIMGTLSGFIGGRFDLIMQRVVDGWMCFPWLFLVLTIMAILGPGMFQVILVLGFVWGIGSSRVVRGAVIAIKENMYVEVAVAVGSPTWKILFRHILPNTMAPIIILFTTGVGGMILGEASISFLGYGIPPPAPSWGGMLSGVGRYYMTLAPWMIVWPGLALAIVVYGINMLGDALRDILDPKLRGGLGRYGVTRGRKKPPTDKKGHEKPGTKALVI